MFEIEKKSLAARTIKVLESGQNAGKQCNIL